MCVPVRMNEIELWPLLMAAIVLLPNKKSSKEMTYAEMQKNVAPVAIQTGQFNI